MNDPFRQIAAILRQKSARRGTRASTLAGMVGRHWIAVSGQTVNHYETKYTGGQMSLSLEQQFDANLPGLSKPIRIMTQRDAEIFTCRWTVRDKDPALKVLLREMQRANSSATATTATLRLKQALASRGLL